MWEPSSEENRLWVLLSVYRGLVVCEPNVPTSMSGVSSGPAAETEREGGGEVGRGCAQVVGKQF